MSPRKLASGGEGAAPGLGEKEADGTRAADTVRSLAAASERSGTGAEMYDLVRELYPICRSITGHGLRQSLQIIGRRVPLTLSEVPSGLQVLDWTVPNEWNIRAGWIARSSGERVIDFENCNLHVMGYSVPVRRRLQRSELDAHLYSLPDRPACIPYRTSYYQDRWGFCLNQNQRDALTDAEYDVCIDASLAPGHLTYAECVVPGESTDEILISAHTCHPSLCNDNLSGVAVATFLAQELLQRRLRHSVRFLFIPGTIGSICWLARNRERVSSIRHALSLVCLGDASALTYKRTLHGAQEVDRVLCHVLRASAQPHRVIDYYPYGYDERQFNSPGFRVPMGSLMRAQHGTFPEYHTSADDLSFVLPDQLAASLELCLSAIEVLDENRRYQNLAPYGEPQLGRRGVYRAIGGADIEHAQLAALWVLTLSDGEHDLVHIAERAGLPFAQIRRAAELLEAQQLLRALAPPERPSAPVQRVER
jgi:aminopeptidase-like protein